MDVHQLMATGLEQKGIEVFGIDWKAVSGGICEALVGLPARFARVR